ncbi:RWD domain-containing protein [Fistulina hepatica ATCC 64428]|nr:RWD domain-containing protein [Fistulina hepatica ATCC 64428]
MSYDVLLEEFEVLESIYPTELSKISERDIQINAEPDDVGEGAEVLKLTLKVHYPHEYPDVVPDLSFDVIEGNLNDSELDGLLQGLKSISEENLGMAMTFTLVSHLRERLSELVRKREGTRKAREHEKERLELEAEEARTRGTPVTIESFRAWKAAFDAEIAARQAKEDELRLKALTPKEREEWKKMQGRLSGRQLFERNRNLEDELLMEEGSVSVDASEYERRREEEEEEEEEEDNEEHLTFSDSD